MSVTEYDKLNRIKQLREIIPDTTNEDEKRAYFIQLENLLPKANKTLYIDADGLIYYAAYSPNNISSVTEIEGSFIGEALDNSKELHDSFNSIVAGVVKACKELSLLGKMNRFKDYKLVFTPSTNFRYDLSPNYKISRKDRERSKEEQIIKKYAYSIGIVVEGVEADDVVAYYGRHGHPIASGDKDVIYGVYGRNYFYHPKHQKVVETSKEDANRFVLLQSLMGDSADDIQGIKGLGIKSAEALLGDSLSFDRVIEIYEGKNIEVDDKRLNTSIKKAFTNNSYTKEDAILTRRLVGMDQWKGFRRGLKIYGRFNKSF
jgi:5'-3' exonuclease